MAYSVAAAGLIFAVLVFIVQPKHFFSSDFYSFWAGARLAGSDLYDRTRIEQVQHTVSERVEEKPFIRPPYYALMLWPLGQMPFVAAYTAWFLLNFAGLVAFVLAWRNRADVVLLCAAFLPLAYSFGLGQDSGLMLGMVGCGARLIEREKQVAGGLVLSLLAIKPHLFAFVPLVLLAQKRYKPLAAMAAAGAGLYLVSAIQLGPDWPVTFVRAAMGNEATIDPRLVGVAGLINRFGAPKWLLAVAAATGSLIVYWRARNAAWLPSIAFAVAAGVVFAPRSLLYDGSLLLPALLPAFAPMTVAGIGIALLSVASPIGFITPVLTLVILWFVQPRRLGTAGTDPGGRTKTGQGISCEAK